MIHIDSTVLTLTGSIVLGSLLVVFPILDLSNASGKKKAVILGCIWAGIVVFSIAISAFLKV